VVILLQKVASDVDKGARTAILSQLSDEGFGLLDEEFEGGGGGFAEGDCGAFVSICDSQKSASEDGAWSASPCIAR
jgi:hypothetical protein